MIAATLYCTRQWKQRDRFTDARVCFQNTKMNGSSITYIGSYMTHHESFIWQEWQIIRRWDRMPPSNQGVLGAIFLRELCHIYARCCYSDPRGCKKRPKRLLPRPEPGSVLDGCENPNPAISYLLLPFKILENHQVSWHIMPDDWWILMTLIANCAGWMMCWFLYVKGDIKWPVLPPKNQWFFQRCVSGAFSSISSTVFRAWSAAREALGGCFCWGVSERLGA